MADIINLQAHLISKPANGVNLYQVPNASMEVLEDIINATWNLALTKSDSVTTKVADVTGATGMLDPDLAPTIAAGTVAVPSITEPYVDIPANATVDDIFDKFTTEYIELATWLAGQFTTFRDTYFPDEQVAYQAMEDWLEAALANPEVGLPPAVASQIWTDDRDRITYDTTRAQADILDVFAARRFPLPPGAAANAAIQIQMKSQDEIAESSRKVATMSVDMQKFNVENLLKLRDVAMRDAVDYVKALASAPDMVSRMTNIGYDAQSKLISSVSSYYNARTQAQEVMSKVSQYNNSLAFDASKSNQAAELNITELNLKALLADIASIAQQATAALNNLHVGVTMQAGGSTLTTQAQVDVPGT